MIKIDDTDRKILFELDKNARRSVKQIAKAIKIKRDTAAYRIKQLEKNEIIPQYFTVIDFSKLGYHLARLYLKFQDTTLEKEQEIIEYLTSNKSIFTVYNTEGDWHLAMGFLVKSLDQFKQVLTDIEKKYKPYINSSNVAVFTEYVNYFRNYLVPENMHDYSSYTIGKGQKVSFDDTDIKLLRIIAKNAKLPLLEIAKKLKLTSMAVHYRLKELEKKGIILGYKALIDHAKLGYEYYKIDLDIEDLSQLDRFKQFAKRHPNIMFEDVTIGGSDFEFDAELQGYEGFYELINEVKRKFPGIIRSYTYYKNRKVYKYVYFPED